MITRPIAADDHPDGRLSGELKATKSLLEFLSITNVASPPGHIRSTAEQAVEDDEWGLDLLEADRSGKG